MWSLNIPENDKAEFVGQIIDIFEDFLAERNVEIDNDDRDEARCEMGDDEDTEFAIIYGCDYGELQTSLETMFEHWSKK